MLGWMACWNVHKQVREDIKVQIICKSKFTKPYPSLVPRPFLVGGKLLVHAAVCVAHGDKLIVYLYRHTHTVQRHISSVGVQWDKEGLGINLNDFINSLIKHILIITFGPNAAGPSPCILLVHLPPASPSPSHILLSTPSHLHSPSSLPLTPFLTSKPAGVCPLQLLRRWLDHYSTYLQKSPYRWLPLVMNGSTWTPTNSSAWQY